MTFELMSNGTLAELPQTFLPEGITAPEGPYVIVLLPHNRYLLGSTGDNGAYERWVLGRPGEKSQDIFLYKDEDLKISPAQDERLSVTLPANTVNKLKNELLSQMTPPGDHFAAIIMLKQLMPDDPILDAAFLFSDEQTFINRIEAMGSDIYKKIYWTSRFASARREFDEHARLKAWLKAGPELIDKYKENIKVWFSLQEEPDNNIRAALDELGFPDIVLNRILAQNSAPLIIYNPPTGYLLLTKSGIDRNTSFFVWSFMPSELWDELRERKKLLIQDISFALWAQRDIERALEERAKYMKIN